MSPFRWLADERARISLLPIVHDDIWALRKTIEGLHWIASEVDLTGDKNDWATRMTPEEREFVKLQLAFFARVDIDVLDYLGDFAEEVDCLESRMVFAAQADQECVHAESYALQIEAVLTGAERDRVLNAVRHMAIIAKMREWVLRNTGGADGQRRPIGERLLVAAAIEGVLFSASFCSLQWLRSRKLLPGITKFNKFIARDEWVHTQHSCLLARRYLREKPGEDVAHRVFGEVVALLDEFITESLPVRLIGMNDELMREYVRFQADRVLLELSCARLYGTKNPFRFMDELILSEVGKTNFFEENPSEYQGVTTTDGAKLAFDDTPVDE